MRLFTKLVLTTNIVLIITLVAFTLTVTHNTRDTSELTGKTSYSVTKNFTKWDNTKESHISNSVLADVTFTPTKEERSYPEPDFKVRFHEKLKDTLQNYWNKNPNKEFGVCVDGYVSIKNNQTTYVINNVHKYRTGSESSIASIECYSELGTLHSHPHNTPYWSNSDQDAFKHYTKDQHNKLMIIMYNQSQFVVYNEKFLEKDYKHMPKTYEIQT